MWFFALVVWLILCALAGTIADKKGRMGWAYFGISFFLSPLVGILLAALQSPIEENIEKQQIEDGKVRKCPYCAELIKPDAKVCKHCGRDVEPVAVGTKINPDTGGMIS